MNRAERLAWAVATAQCVLLVALLWLAVDEAVHRADCRRDAAIMGAAQVVLAMDMARLFKSLTGTLPPATALPRSAIPFPDVPNRGH